MSPPRITLARIMVAVLLIGFLLAALRAPSPFWAVASFQLAVVLLAALRAPIVAWARKDDVRFAWAAFAVGGWARLGFWWLIRGMPDLTAVAPWSPLV